MAIRQTRPYSDLIPSDIRDLRNELRDKYEVELPEPGWYIGRINEQDGDVSHSNQGNSHK
jgi:hypothetical protein